VLLSSESRKKCLASLKTFETRFRMSAKARQRVIEARCALTRPDVQANAHSPEAGAKRWETRRRNQKANENNQT
jgi:hypothetical protein